MCLRGYFQVVDAAREVLADAKDIGRPATAFTDIVSECSVLMRLNPARGRKRLSPLVARVGSAKDL
jgi:hypothetical protein